MSTYQESLDVINQRCEGNFDGEHSEYARGMIELVADLFAVPGMDTSTRMDEIRRDLDELVADERRDQAKLDGAADLSAALRVLYRLTEGDEAQVGEILYECNKVARQTWED